MGVVEKKEKKKEYLKIWRANHPNKHKEYSKKYYQIIKSDPIKYREYLDKQNINKKTRYKNSEEIRTKNKEYHKKWYAKHPDYNKNWRLSHSNFIKINAKKRYQKIMNDPIMHENYLIKKRESYNARYKKNPLDPIKRKARREKFLKNHPDYSQLRYQKIKNDPEKYQEYLKKKRVENKKYFNINGPAYKRRLIKIREKNKILQDKIISIIIEKGKCELCGLSDIRTLQIHHINGHNHKRNYQKELIEIIENKVEYQIICANCHAIIHGMRGRNRERLEVMINE